MSQFNFRTFKSADEKAEINQLSTMFAFVMEESKNDGAAGFQAAPSWRGAGIASLEAQRTTSNNFILKAPIPQPESRAR
jgi:hypothetical protein